jgi:hypothetical protein
MVCIARGRVVSLLGAAKVGLYESRLFPVSEPVESVTEGVRASDVRSREELLDLYDY